MKKIIGLILLSMMLINISNTPILATNSTGECEIQKDIIEWRYKVMNGALYKRKYNASKDVWIGDWIKC